MSALHSAFASDPALLARVLSAATEPKLAALLHDISNHIIALKHSVATASNTLSHLGAASSGFDSPSKKRKLADAPTATSHAVGNGTVANHNGAAAVPSTASWIDKSPLSMAPDLSVAVPVRKKLRFEIIGNNDGSGGLLAVNPAGEKEIAMAWSDVDQVISVPVPEKAQPAHYFVLLPTTTPLSSQTNEAVVFTVPAGPVKNVAFPGGSDNVRDGETYDGLVKRLFDQQLKKYGKSVVVPDEREFVSGVVQAHRKGEKGWHVKAWRGTKDGYLYFVRTGILFGFRKPLLFFPFHAISSISYSSVLQRTFNLNINASTSGKNAADSEEEEIEFGMLDQADFAGIDAYIKRHGLNDASLAEARRAKFYNVNRGSTVKHEGNDGAAHAQINGVTGASEDELAGNDLDRRERELQDAEDAEEEDYDPSGGSSEGSGDDSDDGEEQEGGGGSEEDLDEEVEEEVGGYEDEDEGEDET